VQIPVRKIPRALHRSAIAPIGCGVMDWTVPFILAALAGYISGATPFGYLAGKLRGIDVREHGSRNIGATNVIRVCGKGIGIPVFILDVIKGWLPAWLALGWFAVRGASAELSTTAAIVAGMSAVLGHNYTFWLSGRGGKGVATSTGALLAVAPLVVGIALVLWFILMKVTRYVSLASIVAGALVPVMMAVQMMRAGQWNGVLLGFGLVLATLVVLRHKANIQRLLAGTENKVGAPKA
jgi:acyl phosphate:glycerol-3-phosphate acyltransferase